MRISGVWKAHVAVAVVAVALLAQGATPAAARVTVKLATLVPDGSVWDEALKEMGDDWRQLSEGRVSLRVYPGGVAGDESDVLRKIRIGQLQAGTFTTVGLAEIDEDFKILTVPLFFESYDELFHVLDRLRPHFEERLAAKGFVLLNWGHAGWVHLFSRRPVREMADLKKLKIFVWAGEDEMISWWKRNGYQPVPLAATDIMTGLQTGMIDVLPTTPLAALALQWFRQTPYMQDLGLAPLVGGTVVTRKTWEKIPAADRAVLLEAADRLQRRLEEEIPGQDGTAIAEMSERGLEVVAPADVDLWKKTAEEFAASMRGSMVPAEIFDRAVAIRDAYRRDSAVAAGRARAGGAR